MQCFLVYTCSPTWQTGMLPLIPYGKSVLCNCSIRLHCTTVQHYSIYSCYNCARNININFVECDINCCSKAWQLCTCLWVKKKACRFVNSKTDVIDMLECGRHGSYVHVYDRKAKVPSFWWLKTIQMWSTCSNPEGMAAVAMYVTGKWKHVILWWKTRRVHVMDMLQAEAL